MLYYKNSKTNMIWVVPFIAILITCIAQPALAVSAGSLVAWGNNDDGQCDVPEGNNFTAICADGRDYFDRSWQHSIALKSNGSLDVWGCDDCNVPANNNFTAVATGFYHTLGLKSDSSLAAWGVNDDNECNVPAGNNFTAIAAGEYHSIALKSDGSLAAWGYDGDGQCDVPAGNDFIAIAAGAYHNIALKSDGSLVAWGVNDDNECNVPAGNNFIAIAAGDMHSLALKSDGSLIAWGVKGGVYDFNQCDVPTGNEFTAISAGGYHNLAIKSDGSLVAWGANYYGQCNVPAGNNFTAIAAGGFHNLAIVSSPALFRKFGSFDNQKNVKLTLKDCDGNDVTFSLNGGGYGMIDSCDCTFSNIALYPTTEKSAFAIKTRGKVETSVGSIISDEPLKSITAKTTNLRGDITVNGSLGALTLNDVADGHTITIGSPSIVNPNATVKIVFDRVSDLTINSDTPIKSLTATEWLGGSINAPSIGSITTKGDLDVDVTSATIQSIKVAGTLSGDWTCDSIKSISAADIFETNLTLNQQPDAQVKVLALGKLTTKGWIESSQILSTGNIGTVTAGAMIDSNCFAGVADGITGLPAATIASFSQTATIKSVVIKGIKTEPSPYYINSNIAAANILSASIIYPKSDNSGEPFGMTAGYIKKLTIKNTDGTTTLLKEPKVTQVLDNLEIRLY